ncbi:amino acid adenylation domain-containing protein [Streptomyces noursei]|uniref:amino acid adenylation domain-containing protein n=1 Tax=Streptomyces noursei TaxID=1971 RepID=UPI00333190EC
MSAPAHAGPWGDLDPTVPVHALVARQAAATPRAVAVADATGRWTYAELLAAADALATRLARAGVGPGHHVGVHLPRRRALVAALLATLQRGAAYVPLDPAYPAERLAFLTRDAAPTVLVHAAETRVDPSLRVPVLDVDEALATAPGSAPPAPGGPAAVTPDTTAYVIYTSGSTGRPKGVLVPHRGISGILQYARGTFGFRPDDAVLALASLSFDFAALEVLLPLVSGGTLHLLDRRLLQDPAELGAEVADRGITFLMGTPSMFDTLTATGWAPPHRLTVVCGGETLPAATVAALDSARAVWNIYGPTETSVFSTCCRVTPDDVTIGTPVAGTTVRILDGTTDAGDGSGEICIGGTGVALGYLGRPELTREKFVDDPLAPGRTLYRTGDLGRRRPDGRIDYLGRADDQVKIRGHRIELGAVEAALRALPAVHEAAVVAEDRPGGNRLVAYVVAADLAGTAPEDIRRQLAATLPAHEVPQRLHLLAALPRNANGKLDRRALQATAAGRDRDRGPARTAPRTSTEQALAALWCEALGLDEVGVDENFFAIGGDSLSALRTVARCRRAGLHLDPRALYEAPTVEQLAARVGTGHAGPPPATGAPPPATGTPPAPARPEEAAALAGTAPLLPAQHRFFGWTFGEIGHYNEPLLFAVDHSLDRAALARCLVRLAARHPALTSRFVEVAGELRARPGDPAAAVPLEWHDDTGLDEAAADRAFTDAAQRLQHRLDLREGPVCRAAYFRRDGGDRLLLLLHHLVCDGVTLHTLAEELSALYRETAAGLDDTLGPPPPSALDYARELQDFADALPRETPELDAWLRLPWHRVRPFPTTVEGPDGPAPAPDPGSLHHPHLRTLRTSLDPRTARTVRTVAQSSPYTTEDLLIAAVARGVAEFSGASAACLDVVRHGRLSPLTTSDLSRTVGWLSTITPFVLDTAADGTPPGAPSAAGALPDLRALSAQIGRLHEIEHVWGVLRHLHRDPVVAGRLDALPKPEVYLNFRGAGMHDLPVGPPFSLVTGDTGVSRTPTHPQPYPLEIRIDVADERLDLHWKFSLRRNAEDDVRRLARRCTDLIAHLAESATGA